MKEEVKKINFFKKVWYSISKFERYPEMATEGLKRAIKYLIILSMILTIFVMIKSLVQMKTLVGDLAQYVNENIPDFSYSDGKIKMENEKEIIIEKMENVTIDRIVINTLAENEEQKEQVEKNNLINGITVFLFNDEIILKTKNENGEELRQPYTYSDFIENYIGENIKNFNKAELVEYLTSEKMRMFYVQYSISIFIYLLIINILFGLLDSLEVALFGWITTNVIRMKMRFVAIYNMAIYSLTLPIILNIFYIIINYFTDFTINYFQFAYITIAYICLAAAIFIIKDDFIKRIHEVERIKKEQEKISVEIKKEQDKKKEETESQERNKDDDKEENKDDEVQGSQA